MRAAARTPSASESAGEEQRSERSHRQQPERDTRREEPIEQPAGYQTAGQAGRTHRGDRQRRAMSRDAAIGQESGKVSDGAVLSDGTAE